MADRATQARELSRITSNDRGLDPSVRERAGVCALLCAGNQPALAMKRLTELYEETAPDLPTTPPQVDYARCIGILSFWRFNLAPDIKTAFPNYANYRRFIESDANPAMLLTRHLGAGPLAPAKHSWLIPAQAIAGLTADLTKRRLNFEHQPPYVVMIFSITRMRAVDLQVREPCSIDAIPQRLTHWRPGDVPDERIDHEIPRAALERLEWRP